MKLAKKSGIVQFARGLLLVFEGMLMILIVFGLMTMVTGFIVSASPPQNITLHNQTILLWRGYGWNGVFYLKNCISSGVIEGPFNNDTQLNGSQLNESISILNKRYSSNMQEC